jgi:predicted nucleic acid-binding protein
MSGVVLDTNVVVAHVFGEDPNCSTAVVEARRGERVIVCEKLLREYRDQLACGSIELYGTATRQLMRLFPNLVKSNVDPQIRIDFGPVEDRFHMQLAIDYHAEFHVTKENKILDEHAKMLALGVKEVHPQQYVRECRSNHQTRR